MKSHSTIKAITLCVLFIACIGGTQAQQVRENSRSTALSACDVYQIRVASYHCFSSQFLSIKVRKECDGYVADWSKHFGKFALTDPSTGTTALSVEQLVAMSSFAQYVSPSNAHKVDCQGTTYFTFASDDVQKQHRLCGCAPNVFDALFDIMYKSKSGSVQHQLSKSKTGEQ